MRGKFLHGLMVGTLTVLLVLFMAAGHAEEGQRGDDGQYRYVLEDGGAVILGCVTYPSGELTIPSKMDGYPVTGIIDMAFEFCEEVTGVAISEGVTYIGEYAFNGCFGLTSVTLPRSLTRIGKDAFTACKLKSVTLPAGLTSIGDEAFVGNNLISITIPASVTSIGINPFHGSTLESIDVSRGNPAYEQIGGALIDKRDKKVVAYPGARKGAYAIPDGTLLVGENAFRSSSGLTGVTIPGSVMDIGDSAFRWCESLTSVTISDGVASIGDSAFLHCDGLSSVIIPGSVRAIGDSAFWRCISLTSVTIQDGVASIGDRAFDGCVSLTSVTIPYSVTEIGGRAFEGCKLLTLTVVEGSYAEQYAKEHGVPYIAVEDDARENRTPVAPPIPALDAEGAVVTVSEADKKNLARLFSAANPSDLLISFNFGDDIDHTMWVAGFAAWYHSDEPGCDPDLFSEDVGTHFASLWDAYHDGWDLLDEADPPPPDILPYSPAGCVSDSMYYRAKNETMQSLIMGLFGREMAAPEEHIRYYDGYFYFGHIGDCEERLWFGYDYAVDAVYDLSDGYYKIEGKAALYDYAEGDLEDTKVYEALVKKDAAAEYTYVLLAQRFSECEDDWHGEDNIGDGDAWHEEDKAEDEDDDSWWFDDEPGDEDWLNDAYPGMFDDGWTPFDGTLNQRMATRTGPGTKYAEDHGTLPESTEIVVYAREDSGGTPWVLVEFVRGGKLVRAYTGMKRVDVEQADLPKTTKNPKNAAVTEDTTAYYGPDAEYCLALDTPVAAGTEVLVYGVDRGFMLVEYANEDGAWTRAWVPMPLVSLH